MSRRRALLFSAGAHALLLGALALGSRPAADAPGEDALLRLPPGAVFVRSEPAFRPGGLRPERPPQSRPPPGEPAGRPLPAPAPEASGPPSEESGPAGSPEGDAEPVGRIEPRYPELSRRLGEQGEAEFELRLDPRGEVAAVRLTRSSGFPRLDRAAEEALAGARFRSPSKIDAGKIRRYRVEFRLDEPGR